MSLEQVFASHLAGAAGISAIAGTRMYIAGEVPESASYPCLTYFIVDTVYGHSQAGRSGLHEARIQVDCWSTDPDECRSLADAVVDACDGQRGILGSDGAAGEVATIVAESDQMLFTPPSDGSEEAVHRVMLELVLWHRV